MTACPFQSYAVCIGVVLAEIHLQGAVVYAEESHKTNRLACVEHDCHMDATSVSLTIFTAINFYGRNGILFLKA